MCSARASSPPRDGCARVRETTYACKMLIGFYGEPYATCRNRKRRWKRIQHRRTRWSLLSMLFLLAWSSLAPGKHCSCTFNTSAAWHARCITGLTPNAAEFKREETSAHCTICLSIYLGICLIAGVHSNVCSKADNWASPFLWLQSCSIVTVALAAIQLDTLVAQQYLQVTAFLSWNAECMAFPVLGISDLALMLLWSIHDLSTRFFQFVNPICAFLQATQAPRALPVTTPKAVTVTQVSHCQSWHEVLHGSSLL